jgi:hypothetical protein
MLVRLVRIASAVLLLAIGGIHLFLVLVGAGGLLIVPFLLNAVAGVGLAAGMLLLRGRLLALATVLGLLFAIASLLALLLALTVGLFGIHEHWTFLLVPQTVVVDAIAVVVLAFASAFEIRGEWSWLRDRSPGARGRLRDRSAPGAG